MAIRGKGIIKKKGVWPYIQEKDTEIRRFLKKNKATTPLVNYSNLTDISEILHSLYRPRLSHQERVLLPLRLG